MSRDTNSDWKRIALDEPYWGVLSVDQYRGKTISDEALGTFFESGEGYVANLLGIINRFLMDRPIGGSALDFGCGVGRLVVPLCRHFDYVVGVDIAEEMLAIAERNTQRFGLRNANFVLSDDTLSRIGGGFDLVNTLIVLQHIPPDRGLRLMRRLIEATRVGGVCSLQLTYARDRRFLVHEGPRATFYRREGDRMVDILPSDAAPPEGTITMFDYDLNQVMALVTSYAGHPVLTIPTNDDGHLGVHFVFVRAR
jgi:SAM-dependent methyltransferase